jgi:hypothetical protein
VPGRKRGLAVDTLGLLIAVVVTAASVTDTAIGVRLLDKVVEHTPTVSLALVDAGFKHDLGIHGARLGVDVEVEVVKRSDAKPGFVPIAKRWVVELADLATTRQTLTKILEAEVTASEPALISEPYQQILAVFTGDRGVLRAKDICLALLIGTEPKDTEGIRAKLKRLVNRQILIESQPGLFTLTEKGHNFRTALSGTHSHPSCLSRSPMSPPNCATSSSDRPGPSRPAQPNVTLGGISDACLNQTGAASGKSGCSGPCGTSMTPSPVRRARNTTRPT